ncbi:MAG: hypothetical protein LBS96_00690, partial [Oscillospiraceae bacterium]|nr:hypothetical protein [Oscillospiraceae bacterium]
MKTMKKVLATFLATLLALGAFAVGSSAAPSSVAQALTEDDESAALMAYYVVAFKNMAIAVNDPYAWI